MLKTIGFITLLATLPCLALAAPLSTSAGAASLIRSARAAPPPRPARETCPSGTERYRNQDIDREVCCDYELSRKPCNFGEEPVPCDDRKSFAPTCRPCPEGTFQTSRRSLSDTTYYKCRMKKHCDHYKDRGTPYTDATCACPQDQWLRDDGVCLPRYYCEPGYGQTVSGGCERCTEGKTYSNEGSNTAICKPVTNCESQSRCTVRKATIISDNKCGPKTFDLRLCRIETTTLVPKSTIPDMPDHGITPQHPSSTHGGSPNYTAEKVGGSVGGLMLLCLLLAVVTWKVRRRIRKRRYLDLEARHLSIAKLISDMSVADDIKRLREGVFQIVKHFLAVKAPAQWENLGEILLGDAFIAIKATLKANTSLTEAERMQEMLDEWREPCETTGPDLASLFRAMYAPKHRKILKLGSVYEDIKREYGTRIGIPEDATPGSSETIYNDATVSQRLSCVKCHDCDDAGSVLGNSSEGLLERNNRDEIKSPTANAVKGPIEVKDNPAYHPSVLSFEGDDAAADPLPDQCGHQMPQSRKLYESNV